MPQYNYGEQPRYLLGQIQDYSPCAVDSFKNPLLVQIDEWAFAGFAAGVYTWTIVGEEGTFTVSVTNPANLAAVIAAFDAEDDLLNILTASDNGGDLRLTFKHEGYTYTTSATSTGSALTKTAVQAAAGVNIPLGVVVVRGGADDTAVVPGAAAADDDFLGIVIRNEESEYNPGNYGGVGGDDVISAGGVLSVLRQGRAVVEVEDAVTAGGDVFVRTTATGSEQAGAIRSDADGGDAIAMTGARFHTSAGAGGLAVVTINRP